MRFFLVILCFFFMNIASAQNLDVVEMADAFRSEGKIYVVVAVLSTILLGIGYYLWTIDRRLSRMEKQQKENLPE